MNLHLCTIAIALALLAAPSVALPTESSYRTNGLLGILENAIETLQLDLDTGEVVRCGSLPEPVVAPLCGLVGVSAPAPSKPAGGQPSTSEVLGDWGAEGENFKRCGWFDAQTHKTCNIDIPPRSVRYLGISYCTSGCGPQYETSGVIMNYLKGPSSSMFWKDFDHGSPVGAPCSQFFPGGSESTGTNGFASQDNGTCVTPPEHGLWGVIISWDNA